MQQDTQAGYRDLNSRFLKASDAYMKDQYRYEAQKQNLLMDQEEAFINEKLQQDETFWRSRTGKIRRAIIESIQAMRQSMMLFLTRTSFCLHLI